ncbi:unnamed protein product [Ceutorhynchus assimilis]|uniref:Translin-associated protein X n=1 Tax=Ceutorhynchus assimilis TaxID=467358 RepID=A0A9N9MCR9_9CUCU|nr:unnamed protein product [Ceutorhynchus assimilis]
MSKYKGNFRQKRNKPVMGKQGREVLEALDESNPVIQMFKSFAAELDDKHDRYERIVKLSRDITIEAKRIIFLLHNFNIEIDSKRDSILEEAKTRLTAIFQISFLAIAKELQNHNAYLYHRAFTAGMQEFIEALCFYQFVKEEKIDNWKLVNNHFQYTEEDNPLSLLFTQYDFLLGIADFTGELMRKCINTIGSGNVSDCFKTCNFVKAIHTGFLGLSYTGNREISRKAYVLKQSLNKMELVCYNLQIRGKEIPRHMLLNVIEFQDTEIDADEGFVN